MRSECMLYHRIALMGRLAAVLFVSPAVLLHLLHGDWPTHLDRMKESFSWSSSPSRCAIAILAAASSADARKHCERAKLTTECIRQRRAGKG